MLHANIFVRGAHVIAWGPQGRQGGGVSAVVLVRDGTVRTVLSCPLSCRS